MPGGPRPYPSNCTVAVDGTTQHDLQVLLGNLNISSEGRVGEHRGRLFLNFASPADAGHAARSLNGCHLPGRPDSCVSAFVKSSGGQQNQVNSTSQSHHAALPARPQSGQGKPAGQGRPVRQASNTAMVPAECTVVITASAGTCSGDLQQLAAAWQQGGQFAAAGALSVSGRPPLIYVNFSSSAQAAAAVQVFDSAYQATLHRASLKSAFGNRLSWTPYMADNLRPADEQSFCSAGVLLLHRDSHGLCHALLGKQNGRLTLLGGMRRDGTEASRATAAREFNEESADQLTDDLRHLSARGVSSVNSHFTAELIADCPVIWLGGRDTNSKYALYIVDISERISHMRNHSHLQPRLSIVLDSLPANFLRCRQRFFSALTWKSSNLEMQSLHWIQLDRSKVVAAASKDMSAFLAKVVAECQPLRQWAAETVQATALPSLKSNIQAAQEAARLEEPALRKAITALTVPTPPPPEPTAPSDIVTIASDSREFQVLQTIVGQELSLSGREVKKVQVADREARFNAWKCTLPIAKRDVTQVFHGTNPVSAANSIARTGPDFSRIGASHGHRIGKGFYSTRVVGTAQSYATEQGAICICRALQGIRKVKSLDSNETAGSLLEQGFHSVHEEGTDFIVLFHPDAVYVTHIIHLGPEDGMEQHLTLEREALKKQHEAEELQRKMELQAKHLRLKMIAYFCQISDALQAQLHDDTAVDSIATQFGLEHAQFQQGLPMYARKGEFQSLLHGAQCIVLIGGTGIGKSVTVPQWVFDNYLAKKEPALPVAVLVPRRAIAEGLSSYISKVRGCQLGQEVGLGMGGACFISADSRIVFMTYGFFLGVSKGSKLFEKWGAVILDEAHERKEEADKLLPQLAAACKARPDFKAIIMSATIESGVFVNNLQSNGVPGSVQTIEVPGVTFPVKDVWWEGEDAWDPQAEGAIQILALESIRVYLQEKRGNLLVFVSTLAAVHELVENLRSMLEHDTACQVLGLYAALNEDERDEVINFSDLKKYPQNSGKRLICASTNIAEAGVTIQGVTAVLETGWQLEQQYDSVTRISSLQHTRISKASQQQRRGRAGRTQPGTCYTLYSKACFESESFPAYGVPDVLKTNLDAFLLGMIAADLDPLSTQDEAMQLLDQEKLKPILESSKQHLLKMGALKEDTQGKLFITDVGQMLTALPVSLELGLSIVAAAQLECSEELAMIASVASVGGGRVFARGQPASASRFAARSGDHETYLNVFEAWQENNKDPQWCHQEGLLPVVLEAADELLRKVHQAMCRNNLPISTFQGTDGRQRSSTILQSLCSGYFHQLATAADKSNPKKGFWLVDQGQVNPRLASLHRGSVLNGQSDMTMVLFSEATAFADGKQMLCGVSKVDPDWALQAASFSGGSLDELKQALEAMAREEYSVPLSGMPEGPNKALEAAILAVHSNVKDLRKEFPLATFKTINVDNGRTAVPTTLVTCCPVSMRTVVLKRMQQAADAIQFSSTSISTAGIAPDMVQLVLDTRKVRAFRDQLEEDFGCYVKLEMDTASKAITVTSLKVVLPDAERRVRLWLGLPVQTASVLGQGPLAAEQKALKALEGSCADDIFAEFGRGKVGSMMALTQQLLHTSDLWVYGGFIRDAIIRGDVHDSMDLDVGLPKSGSIKAAAGMSTVSKLAAGLGLSFVRNNPSPDFRLSIAYFKSADGSSEFEVQVVDTVAFARRQATVDFDVNNLKITKDGLSIKHENEVRLEGRNVDKILRNARVKQLLVLKPAKDVTARIEKMAGRGWTVMFPKKG